jgi:hypothetical protein
LIPFQFSSSEIRNELKSVETEIKYAGYLDQQQRAIDRLKKAEQRRIPDWFDYQAVSGLSREMQEKLGKVVPQTLGQASRIPGVTPGGGFADQCLYRDSGATARADGGAVARFLHGGSHRLSPSRDRTLKRQERSGYRHASGSASFRGRKQFQS